MRASVSVSDKTNARRLSRKVSKTPNKLLYDILQIVIKILSRGVSPTFTFKVRPGEDKGPFILISNHASRVDYLYTCPAVYPRRLNFVVGYNEFYNFPTCLLLGAANVIPKKNFVTDVHCIKQVMKIIADGGAVCFMPEGMSSITGMAQPVMPGSGSLLKRLGVNVYYTKIAGGYLANTKHYLKQRNGKTEVVVDQMFSPSDLQSMTVGQIEDRMNELLSHDDYIWNKEKQYSFKDNGEGMAAELDTLLYMCPKCGTMHRMKCDGDTMTCLECGNAVTIDDKYNIRPSGADSVCPDIVSDWVLLERARARKDVRTEGFRLSEHVRVGMLPEYGKLGLGKTSEICGEGTLALTCEGLEFNGTAKGKTLSFKIPTAGLPTFGMCTDISRFYTYLNGEFIEFYPDGRTALRWDHLVEEMHRANGGKWQDTPYRHPGVLKDINYY